MRLLPINQIGSSPESSLRRQLRHDFVRKTLRNHLTNPYRFMTKTRLRLPRRSLFQGRIPIIFPFFYNTIGCLRQMTGNSSNSRRMAFLFPDPIVKPAGMPSGFLMSMHTDSICRLNESPFQVSVGIGPKAAISHLAAACMDSGSSSRISGKARRLRESVNISHLIGDYYCQEKSDPGYRHKKFNLSSIFKNLLHSFLDTINFLLDRIKFLQKTPGCKFRLGGKFFNMLFKPGSVFLAKYVAHPIESMKRVFRQNRVNSILYPGSRIGKNHPGSTQVSTVSKIRRGNPDFRQSAVALQCVEPMSIKSVGFIDHSHHQLGFAGMNQGRIHPRFLDLIHDPIPAADSLHRYRRSLGIFVKKLLNRSSNMRYSRFGNNSAFPVFDQRKRISFMGVKCYNFHGAPPFGFYTRFWFLCRLYICTRRRAFI